MLGWHPDFCSTLADRGYFVIRFDNRDVGLSDKFPGARYKLADMAQDAVGLLTALGIDSAHVVGQSMGGMIAQRIAIDCPSRVRSLALIYTTPNLDHLLGAQTLRDRADIPWAKSREEAVENYLRNEEPCAGPDYPHDEEWLRILGGQMYDRNYDPEGIDRQLEVLTTVEDLLPALAQSNHVPTLLLHGDADALIDVGGSLAIHGALPHSRLKVYPGMGHQLPRRLWPDILDSITQNAATPSAAQLVPAVPSQLERGNPDVAPT